jgi:hypothetical protein
MMGIVGSFKSVRIIRFQAGSFVDSDGPLNVGTDLNLNLLVKSFEYRATYRCAFYPVPSPNSE